MHFDDAEVAAREILARYRVGVWTIELEDGCGPRMYADATMRELLGVTGRSLTPEELYFAWYDRIEPNHYDAVKDGVDRIVSGLAAEIQYPWIHPVWGEMLVRCGARRDWTCKEYIRLEGTHQDVTELNHVQKESREEIIEQRNVKLQYDRLAALEEVRRKSIDLEKALAEAKRAEQMESMFLATMSHEIRTPLNAVIGYAEFLRSPACGVAERSTYVRGILNSSKALLSLINDVLDLSKIQAGMMPFLGGVCNLRRLFAEIDSIFRFSASDKGVALRMSIPEDMPSVALREERLRQILINLVGNAVKFTARGEVSVAARMRPEAGGLFTLELSVRDTGVGIDSKQFDTIFDPFRQGGGVRGGRVYQGTGLGLSICRRLAESVGGNISVASELGKGSVFTVCLPHVAAVDEAVPTQGQAAGERSNGEARFVLPKGFDVVIVDDVAINLRILAKHLELVGIPAMAVRSFTNARAALAAVRARKPSLVMTDVWMPDMTGADLAAAIRAEMSLADVPIVAETADTDTGETFDVSFFDEILTKPLTGDKIRMLLGRLFPEEK